jgi:hypothetical protein
MTKKPQSFLRRLKGAASSPWRVSLFRWEVKPREPASGTVVEDIEASDIELAILAAHRLIDKYATGAMPMITVEIMSTEMGEGGG